MAHLNPEELRIALENRKRIESDNPEVEKTRLRLQSVEKLADDQNDVFSQLKKDRLQDETFDYALAISFARRPLKNLESRLMRRGITDKAPKTDDKGKIIFGSDGKPIYVDVPVRIEVTVMEEFLKEFLVRRHSLNRKRVDEYIQALDSSLSRNVEPINRETNGTRMLKGLA